VDEVEQGTRPASSQFAIIPVRDHPGSRSSPATIDRYHRLGRDEQCHWFIDADRDEHHPFARGNARTQGRFVHHRVFIRARTVAQSRLHMGMYPRHSICSRSSIWEVFVTYGSHGWTDDRPGHHQGAPQRRKSAAEQWAEIRLESVFTGQTMSANHAHMATNARPAGGRRIAPQAFALLYAFEVRDSFGSPTDRYGVERASRIFAWSDDDRPEYNVKDATALMRTMAFTARDKFNRGSWDPQSLTDRVTPLPDGNAFVGVAVSSLGGDGSEWGSLRSSAFGLEIPAQVLVRLTEGSWIEMSHAGGRGTWRVDSNVHLGYMSFFDVRQSIPPDFVPRRESVHQYVDDLVHTIQRAYDEAKVGTTPRPRAPQESTPADPYQRTRAGRPDDRPRSAGYPGR
jgi:hypothetical protein